MKLHRVSEKEVTCIFAELNESFLDAFANDAAVSFLVAWSSDVNSLHREVRIVQLVSFYVESESMEWRNDLIEVELAVELEEAGSISPA